MQPELRMTSQTTELALAANKVLRNTYMLLGLSMVPTVIGAVIGINLNFSFMAQSPFMGFILMMAVMFGLFWGISKNRENSLGIVLLLGLTFFMGLILGPILQAALHLRNGAQLVGMAAGGTGLIFFSLATIATVTKKDFSFMGKFLFIGLILLIVAMIANMFFQIPAMQLTISAIAVLIFSGFILYDVSRVVTGGETNYIMATLAIYLDIYNLFVHLLSLLMALTGERD
ncbi:hypothetical protein SCD_n01051 [Sulfuricella denitrificans skB26]|uniref:Uncharacterized protein n=1 Tax=Sulfuricella denitrificans (strain DSM 22764 / NBRC 105220 / skB26) TaxID=1163617 RepID=S6A9X9_SULDS|nr:Bax inhibitor-1/YccA family protein [Sulfuricella denitrificans]BAN34890.1 hypothetical protein SCD_n01051 [Sulfuricella denitrificans skB26]